MPEGKAYDDMIRFMKAMDQALNEGKQEYTCPICGGTVRVSVAKYNGHAHAYCDGCGMRLME